MSQAQDLSGGGTPAGTLPVGPVLSFKKRRNKTPPLLNGGSGDKVAGHSATFKLPDVSQTGTPTYAPGTPGSGSNRRVLNRRKALQDFYKLNQTSGATTPVNKESSEAQGGTPEVLVNGEKGGKPGTPDNSDIFEDTDSLLQNLSTDEAVQNFVKTASSREILRARNAAAEKLNFHDLERKSIIYNNYSELIKLNHILSGVFNGQEPENSDFSHAEDESIVTNQSIDSYLADLSKFLKTEASVFNQDFGLVVEAVCLKMDDTDSASSVAGMVGGD